MRKIKSILSGIILIITFILVILLLFAKTKGETPQLFGYQLLRISSESMEPDLMVGDIILSKEIDDPLSVHNGDIVTYNGTTGNYNGKRITHEVVTEPYEKNGTYFLLTKGVANEYPDPEISADMLCGVMVCRLDIISKIYNFFMTPWGLIVILGFLAILFVNEVFALRQLIKENKDDEETIENDSSENVADYKTE